MNSADRTVSNRGTEPQAESEFDPFPEPAAAPAAPLNVDIEDAKRHLALLVKRSERGEKIILTRRGYPVAQIVAVNL